MLLFSSGRCRAMSSSEIKSINCFPGTSAVQQKPLVSEMYAKHLNFFGKTLSTFLKHLPTSNHLALPEQSLRRWFQFLNSHKCPWKAHFWFQLGALLFLHIQFHSLLNFGLVTSYAWQRPLTCYNSEPPIIAFLRWRCVIFTLSLFL